MATAIPTRSTSNFPPDAVSAVDALARLREGNRRFVANEEHAMRHWRPNLIDGQNPFAVVLGCADSRAPAEFVFDQGLGDLFVIRVAGNIVAPSLVGSIEFAARSFGTRLVVVMGHTHCGAVGATVDTLEHGDALESRNEQSIVNRITPHIKHLFHKGSATADRDHATLLREAVQANAIASAREIRSSSPVLEELIDRGSVVIVPAVLDITTGVVTFFEDPLSNAPSLVGGGSDLGTSAGRAASI